MEEKPTIFPTWGYKSDGSSQIFNLKDEDEELPEGWSRQIEPWNHPNSRHLHSRPEAPPSSDEIPEWRRGTPGRPPVDEEPAEPGQGDPDTQPRKRGRPRSTESTGL
jgi:hypothetical protein